MPPVANSHAPEVESIFDYGIRYIDCKFLRTLFALSGLWFVTHAIIDAGRRSSLLKRYKAEP